MHAFTVCVDYQDYLSITLPYNRHHFERVTVITRIDQVQETQALCQKHQATTFGTDAFYADGATFNKWRAIEEALDVMGRVGWVCFLDADILWPKNLKGWKPEQPGFLYCPLRHMHEHVIVESKDIISPFIPREHLWGHYPIHRNVHEWAGYSQVLHASDPHLPNPTPRHETNWRHAGCADSMLQARWPRANKLRTPWNCLHLGFAGRNWMGRCTPFLHGGQHPQSEVRQHRMHELFRNRRNRAALPPNERLDPERLPPGPGTEGT